MKTGSHSNKTQITIPYYYKVNEKLNLKGILKIVKPKKIKL